MYSSYGKWVFPPLLWSFPPSTTLTSFPTPGCWVRATSSCPLQPGLACLFTVPGGIPLSLFSAQGAPPPLLCVFIVLIAYYSVSLFIPGWGSVCPGGYADLAQGCLWENRIRLAHLVIRVFPSHLGAGDWQPGGPPGFSIQHEVEMLRAVWRCGGVKVLPLLCGLACKVCLQRLSKISL
jgi:hypothetical protein